MRPPTRRVCVSSTAIYLSVLASFRWSRLPVALANVLYFSLPLQENGPGLVIYLQQEGRGIGLANKIHAYRLQEVDGLDTVDANRALGLPDDCREYSAVRNILNHLQIESVALLTNNPRKITKMNSLGTSIRACSLVWHECDRLWTGPVL